MSGQLTQYYDYVKQSLFSGNGAGSLIRFDGISQNGIMSNFMNFFAFLLVAAYMGYFLLGKSNKKNKNGDNVNPIPHAKNFYNKHKYTDDKLSSAPKTDEWKHNAWRKWILNLEDKWSTFNRNVDKNKSEWMDQKDAQLIEWVKELQTKWMHFNPNIDQEYKIEFLSKSENWNDDKWKIWMLTEAQQLLENDLKEWLSQAEADYCKWTMDAWTQWKDSQIKEWITLDWKYEEDTFFSKIDELTVEVLPAEEQRLWYAWKERIYKEGSDWKYWTSLKESKYVNENWELWEEWKNEKQEMFSEWLQLYTNKWIQQKQWRLWIGEKMSQNAQNTASESTSVDANADEKKDEEKNDEVKNDEVKNDEVKNDEVKNDEEKKDEEKKDEVKNDEEKKDEVKNDEVKNDEEKKDEVKNDEVKTDEVKNDEVKNDEVKTDEVKNDEVKTDEVKKDEVKTDEVKTDEVKTDEVKNDEVKTYEVKTDEVKNDDSTNNVKARYSFATNGGTKTDEKKEDTDTSSVNGDENKRKYASNPYFRNSILI